MQLNKKNILIKLVLFFIFYYKNETRGYSWDIFFNSDPENKTTSAIALLTFTASSIASYLPREITAIKKASFIQQIYSSTTNYKK